MLQHNRMLATATVVMALVGVIFARLTSARADSQLFVYGGQKKARLQAEALEVVGDFQHPVTEDPSGSQESNLSIAYGIMIDAGSGSTKPTVWSWDPCYKEIPLLKLEAKLDKLPPLSSYAKSEGGDPSKVGDMLAPAMEIAMTVVPKALWNQTPVFLSATAGMRLLPEDERAIVLRMVNVWLASSGNHPFLYGTKPPFDNGEFWAQTISGDEEGAFGFLDINFLMGKLVGQQGIPVATGEGDPAYIAGERVETAIAWIDTGGASLQVSFAPQQSSILGNVYPVSPIQFHHITESTGSRYKAHMLYTYSWNGLGQREGRKRLQKGIMDHAVVGDGQPRFSDGLIYSDPCLLLGQSQKVIVDVGDGQSKEVTFVGSSDFYMCQWFVDVLVLNLREECLMPPCGAAGVYVPQPKNLVFMGFRKMLNLARPLGLASNKGSWAPSTYNEISDLVSKVCSMSGEDVEKAGIEDAWETDSGPCFQGVLMLRFLQTIGSPRIIFADRIGKEDNDKFNYARGAMLINIVHESERRFKVDNWPVCQKDKLTVA